MTDKATNETIVILNQILGGDISYKKACEIIENAIKLLKEDES